ncbi:MAG: hemin receptor [Ferruginibacter sp.]|nr:hemin receptor [Ferruginibacter sp.]
MKKYLLLPALLISTLIYAQIPEDVLRFSYYPQNGTARSLAIGGAMGSLGGDINAIFVNPAGLGNYKTGEFVFTPGFLMNNNKVIFRGTQNKNNKTNFAIGPIGFVYGFGDRYNNKKSQAVSLAITQTANYNNSIQYNGLNNLSSFSEQWAEQVAKSNQTLDDALNNPAFAYGAAPALYTYLVDTFRVNGNVQVKGLPENILDAGQALRQKNIIDTKGAQYEVAFGYAMNRNDKFQFGFTVGIPIMNYSSTSTFTESDTSSNKSNGFDSFTYTDDYTTSGAGVNLKLGLIYKPTEHIRLGFAVHTPTYMVSLKDKRSSSLTANTENYNGVQTVTSETFTNGQPGESKYSMLTPLKVMVSGSYVLREIADVRKQKGFITADIEYVDHHGSNFYSGNEAPTADEKIYYKSLNSVIKDQYKGNFNFRLGGELKFNTVMARLGFAYYTNPYKDAALKANRTLVSGGLGYRHKGFFIDLTYIYSINKDVSFPYRLEDRANTFATINDQRGNIVTSIGFKF